MLDQRTQQTIRGVVEDFVEGRKMFTAFEVSLEAKKRGVQERHRNLKDYVHDSIEEIAGDDDYTRTLRDVGAPVQAWLYHPMEANPYGYQPLNRGGISSPSNSPSSNTPPATLPAGIRNPVPLKQNPTAHVTASDGAFGTDFQGRLPVVPELIKLLGVTVGQDVNVFCDKANEKIQLKPASSSDSTSADFTYIVEGDGSIRVLYMALDKAGISGLQCYHISNVGGGNSGGELVIKPFE